uniref:Uncharacterized protein n=1 Tax=Strongyloides stercoralis TaxID=6248 RepID=A0A0K0E3N7_STRER
MAYSNILTKVTFLLFGFILIITADFNKNNEGLEQFNSNEKIDSFNPYLHLFKKFQYPFDNDDALLLYQINEQIPIRNRKWASQLRYGKRSSWASQLRYGRK